MAKTDAPIPETQPEVINTEAPKGEVLYLNGKTNLQGSMPIKDWKRLESEGLIRDLSEISRKEDK